MRNIGLCAILFAAFVADPVLAAPQCVEMRLTDAQGVLVPVNPPLVGLMIGDTPLFEGSPPPYANAEAGRFVPCPEALLASAREAFDDLCTSEERRKKSAAANGVELSVVNKRCGDLNATLSQ